ncbi:hypothetical protein HYN43_027750 [Mucilaginibacter celer]|uniref:Uncharacterized protein n=1 Tax=Mucilaginibacter celer TaxID=2305508 RepID=A0A494W4W4_9SPHI|nr:hypothetical protein HYN43_027750 [Mucilaginibacter celer]
MVLVDFTVQFYGATTGYTIQSSWYFDEKLLVTGNLYDSEMNLLAVFLTLRPKTGDQDIFTGYKSS